MAKTHTSKADQAPELALKKSKSGSKSAKKAAPKVSKSKSKTAAPKKSKSGSKTVKKSASAKKSPKAKSTKKRYFKLIDEAGRTIGRYTGDTPKQAGSKAFTKLVQRSKASGKKMTGNTNIYLRESTRQSNRKTYGYVASRRKLDEPQQLEILDGETGETKQITYYYRNDVKKIAVPEHMQGGAKKKAGKKGTKGKKPAAKKAGSKAKKSGSKSKKTTTKTKKTATKAAPKTKKAAPKKKASGSKSAKKPAKKAAASK